MINMKSRQADRLGGVITRLSLSPKESKSFMPEHRRRKCSSVTPDLIRRPERLDTGSEAGMTKVVESKSSMSEHRLCECGAKIEAIPIVWRPDRRKMYKRSD